MLQICVDNQNERKLKFLTVIDVVNTFCLNLMLIARNMAFSTKKVPFILHGLRDRLVHTIHTILNAKLTLAYE